MGLGVCTRTCNGVSNNYCGNRFSGAGICNPYQKRTFRFRRFVSPVCLYYLYCFLVEMDSRKNIITIGLIPNSAFSET
jgi:hypothetical protein